MGASAPTLLSCGGLSSTQSIIFKSEKTVKSNCLANRVRKKRSPSYFVFSAWTSNINSSFLQCSGCVQSKNGVDLVEVSIFISQRRPYMSSVAVYFPGLLWIVRNTLVTKECDPGRPPWKSYLGYLAISGMIPRKGTLPGRPPWKSNLGF